MAWRFDSIFPQLTGWVDIKILDPDATPNMVLELGKEWTVELHWTLSGTGATTIGGTWDILVSLEHVGGTVSEGSIATGTKNLTDVETGSTPTSRKFKESFKIASSVPAEEGVYKVVTLITYNDILGNPAPMAGFTEEPLISFYSPA